MSELTEQPPVPRRRVSRLPADARALKPGGYIDVTKPTTAACVVSYGRYKGWKMVRRSSNGVIRVWRIE